MCDDLADLGKRFAFEMQKPHHNIRNLHAGIVDVVLHIDLLPIRPQNPHKRIAQDRIAQMPHMRGLVGIDTGVLHQDMQPRVRLRTNVVLRQRRGQGCAIHVDIEVPSARRLKA